MNWNINFRKLIILVNGIALTALILSILALLDIYQRNEANLDNEWIVIQISFVWFLISIVLNISFAMKFSKK
ncbi:MAG: hypothetical protein DRI95_14645 [Bacteroidetes bacterium]|nr:MAG: hypothetical protein DRI95_14645 [Bacteroidota bacterium]